MPKKLIAGAGVVASLAVALAPLATFAATENVGTDKFEITINTSCTVAADGYAKATTEPAADATAFEHTYTRTINAGSVTEIAGGKYTDSTESPVATTLTVTCNDSYPSGTTTGHGYQIKAAATPLYIQVDDNNGTDTIPLQDPQSGVSGWGVKLSATTAKSSTTGDVDGDMALASGYGNSAYKALPKNGVVASGSVSRAAGDVFTIVGYEVSANNSQKAGTYKGQVTYTFVAPTE